MSSTADGKLSIFDRKFYVTAVFISTEGMKKTKYNNESVEIR